MVIYLQEQNNTPVCLKGCGHFKIHKLQCLEEIALFKGRNYSYKTMTLL